MVQTRNTLLIKSILFFTLGKNCAELYQLLESYGGDICETDEDSNELDKATVEAVTLFYFLTPDLKNVPVKEWALEVFGRIDNIRDLINSYSALKTLEPINKAIGKVTSTIKEIEKFETNPKGYVDCISGRDPFTDCEDYREKLETESLKVTWDFWGEIPSKDTNLIRLIIEETKEKAPNLSNFTSYKDFIEARNNWVRDHGKVPNLSGIVPTDLNPFEVKPFLDLHLDKLTADDVDHQITEILDSGFNSAIETLKTAIAQISDETSYIKEGAQVISANAQTLQLAVHALESIESTRKYLGGKYINI